MRKPVIPIVMLAAAGVVVAAYAMRSDVSTVCADCPGRIECPLTGELVCVDRCPLAETPASGTSDESPTCCRGGG